MNGWKVILDCKYGESEVLHLRELARTFQALEDFIAVLDVFLVILNPGIEDVAERMAAHVFHGEDAHGLSVGIVFVQPQRAQVRNRVDIVFELAQPLLELELINVEMGENASCLSLFLADIG